MQQHAFARLRLLPRCFTDVPQFESPGLLVVWGLRVKPACTVDVNVHFFFFKAAWLTSLIRYLESNPRAFDASWRLCRHIASQLCFLMWGQVISAFGASGWILSQHANFGTWHPKPILCCVRVDAVWACWCRYTPPPSSRARWKTACSTTAKTVLFCFVFFF